MKRLAIAVFVLGNPLPAGDIVINEIYFKPYDKTIPEEFIELYHAGERVVDLSGWFFSSGIAYRFPEGFVLDPGTYLVLAEDPEALRVASHPRPRARSARCPFQMTGRTRRPSA